MSTELQESWTPSTSDFAVRLAMIRQVMGWNAKEAALACELPQASWREWEMTGRQPRNYLKVCEAISARTKVDLIWLLTGHAAPPGGPSGGGLITRKYLATYRTSPRSRGLSMVGSNSPLHPSSLPDLGQAA